MWTLPSIVAMISGQDRGISSYLHSRAPSIGQRCIGEYETPIEFLPTRRLMFLDGSGSQPCRVRPIGDVLAIGVQ